MILLKIIIVIFAAIATFHISRIKKIGAVRASSLLTLIFSLFLFSFLEKEITIQIIPLFYGGTFLGMSCHKRYHFLDILISALIFSFLFEYLIPHLGGMGGALGLSAFLSILIISLCKFVYEKTIKGSIAQ